MSLTLTLKKKPSVPVEAESICPDRMDGLSLKGIAALPLHHGNEQVTVGDFFRVTGENNGEICLEGDTSRFKMVGDSMSKGRLLIKESIGQHLGVHMSGGEIVVAKNAHDWVGPEMSGGRIIVKGNAGPRAGIYLKSGELVVGGDAGYMSGFMMQNGRLIICGNAAKGLGDSMYQGQIWLGGEAVEMGSGVEQVEPEAGELDDVLARLDEVKIKPPKSFKKLQSDRSLWSFNKHDFAAWKDAL